MISHVIYYRPDIYVLKQAFVQMVGRVSIYTTLKSLDYDESKNNAGILIDTVMAVLFGN